MPFILETVTEKLGGGLTVIEGLCGFIGLSPGFNLGDNSKWGLGVTGMFGSSVGLKVDGVLTFSDAQGGNVRDLNGIFAAFNYTVGVLGGQISHRLTGSTLDKDHSEMVTPKEMGRSVQPKSSSRGGGDLELGASGSIDVRGALSIRMIGEALGIHGLKVNPTTGVASGQIAVMG